MQINTDVNNAGRMHNNDIEVDINSDVVSISNVCLNPNIKSKLKFMNTNAQSLQFKMEALKQRIKKKDEKL